MCERVDEQPELTLTEHRQPMIARRTLLLTAVVSAGLGSATLFALEPFVGKVLLPRLGGTPAVWNTCMLAFQLLLLFGYAYTVMLSRMRDSARAARLHALVIAVAALSTPFSVRMLWWTPNPSWPPVMWVGTVVIGAIGLPFCLLSSTSSLLQLWLTRQSEPIPNVHRLYAVTNLSNFAGLGLYVGVLEPLLGVRAQSWVLMASCLVSLGSSLLVARTSAPAVAVSEGVAPLAGSGRARAAWVLYSFAASLALFAVSTHLSTDVAAFPLLFVIPLGVFLLGYALGFSGWAERHRPFLRMIGFLVPLLALVPLLRYGRLSNSASLAFLLPVIALGALVTALALRLADARPKPERLPEYYAAIGVGGVLAGVACVLLLPWGYGALLHGDGHLRMAGSAISHETSSLLLRLAVPEYPVALMLGMGLVARHWLGKVATAGIALVVLVGGSLWPEPVASLYQTRNFFGTLRVKYHEERGVVWLANGDITHGKQPSGAPNPPPTSYYHAASPIGQVFSVMHPTRVLVVGLGVGTLAAYARPGDVHDYYELNPTVADIAEHGPWFSYLRAARARGAKVALHIGDGRLLAQSAARGSYDLVVLDAFSSDSVPVHLMTREALSEFAEKTGPEGVIAAHVSNRFFDLVPVLAAAARELGWQFAVQYKRERTDDLEDPSVWAVLSRDRTTAAHFGFDEAPWTQATPAREPWTDDWTNPLGSLVPVSRWHVLVP